MKRPLLVWIVCMSGCTASGPAPDVVTSRHAEALSVWVSAAAMTTPRTGHAAIALANGKVLVVGGFTAVGTQTSTAELYDPKTNAWSSAGAMSIGRNNFGAVRIDAGKHTNKVLVAGGFAGTAYSSTAELYDPATNTWSLVAPMKAARGFFPLVNLPSAQILASGGLTPASLSTAEIWNAETDTWSSTPPMKVARGSHRAARMNDGRTLVIGGIIDWSTNECAPTAEIFDPATTSWIPGGTLVTPRCTASLDVLPDSTVVAAGGNNGTFFHSSAEVFDPKTTTWKAIAPLAEPRSRHMSVLLSSGRLVVAGGHAAGDAVLSSAELFDPKTGNWTKVAPLKEPRDSFAMAALANDGALVVGGAGPLSSAEIFDETGTKCTTADQCAGRRCVDGYCCDRACNGQCEACDVAGKEGTCTNVAGPPHGMRAACEGGAAKCDGETFSPGGICDGAGTCKVGAPVACGAYACTTKGCLDACTDVSQCAKGFSCKGRACVPACSEDGQSAIAPDGTPSSCNAYSCDPATGACRTACTASSDCATGNVCDLATKVCQSSGAGESSGGCALAPRSSGAAAALLAIVALLGRLRRR